jgi:hypothetical protein
MRSGDSSGLAYDQEEINISNKTKDFTDIVFKIIFSRSIEYGATVYSGNGFPGV